MSSPVRSLLEAEGVMGVFINLVSLMLKSAGTLEGQRGWKTLSLLFKDIWVQG